MRKMTSDASVPYYRLTIIVESPDPLEEGVTTVTTVRGKVKDLSVVMIPIEGDYSLGIEPVVGRLGADRQDGEHTVRLQGTWVREASREYLITIEDDARMNGDE